MWAGLRNSNIIFLGLVQDKTLKTSTNIKLYVFKALSPIEYLLRHILLLTLMCSAHIELHIPTPTYLDKCIIPL